MNSRDKSISSKGGNCACITSELKNFHGFLLCLYFAYTSFKSIISFGCQIIKQILTYEFGVYPNLWTLCMWYPPPPSASVDITYIGSIDLDIHLIISQYLYNIAQYINLVRITPNSFKGIWPKLAKMYCYDVKVCIL